VQESLTNIVRHAQARNVLINLQQGNGHLQLSIQDDGVGFDTSEALASAARGQSCGLLGMQERAELLNGQFRIESTPHHGTRVTVVFPLSSGPE
jgi:signal transduction histidine kinase